MIKLGADICTSFPEATSREWLETNGIGGYANGTVSGAHTRRYHSYLTAATKPPLGRVALVSKLEETLIVDGAEFELSSNLYTGAVHPDGYKLVESFRLDPFPVWTFNAGSIRLEKKLFMVHGQNTTVCRWKILGRKKGAILKVRPLLSFVDYHHLQHESAEAHFECELIGQGSIKVTANIFDAPLFFGQTTAEFDATGYWYRNFELEIEKERGFDHQQDLFQPFELTFDLSKPASMIISTEPHVADAADRFEKDEIKRRKSLVKRRRAKSDLEKQLVLAADQFVVKRGEGHTVIAGYPWFSDWGRDTMIALPGLTLATNRPEIAREILLEFNKHISQGMLPNRFADADGDAEYNTVDATLWYFEAVRAYLAKTGDYDLVRENIYRSLDDIITWHVRGTRYGIQVDENDGLLSAGEEGVQLTWMDAKVGDVVITPRTGKAVEIQALWYNALKIMEDLSLRFGDTDESTRYAEMAERCRKSFNTKFWNADENCLYDVVGEAYSDPSVRPNQIFAVSLPYTMLDGERSKAVVDKVAVELLTAYGLRSLSPKDPKYVPFYKGSPMERDSAYHQGTVWAWLIGGFIDAYRSVYPERSGSVPDLLNGFHRHLFEAGLGQISEIFDAEEPHTPRGCFAQAWSVAEVLRVMTAK
jgi:predicted glycogen debranching enzyme